MAKGPDPPVVVIVPSSYLAPSEPSVGKDYTLLLVEACAKGRLRLLLLESPGSLRYCGGSKALALTALRHQATVADKSLPDYPVVS
jgi:hypothetical protein